MTTTLLMRLITAHLLSDFVLQPESWVEERTKKKIRSLALVGHSIITALLAYLFSGLYSSWWIPLAILISHYLIDLIKSYLKNNIYTFLVDQLLHLAVLIAIWLIVVGQGALLLYHLKELGSQERFWALFSGYLFVTWPLGILIGIATAKWRNELENSEAAREGLASAGKWIGICERLLILTFVLTEQYTAIGFLMTAKSVLRFGDKGAGAEKKSEYVLVGTLLSFASSALLGIGLAAMIH